MDSVCVNRNECTARSNCGVGCDCVNCVNSGYCMTWE